MNLSFYFAPSEGNERRSEEVIEIPETKLLGSSRSSFPVHYIYFAPEQLINDLFSLLAAEEKDSHLCVCEHDGRRGTSELAFPRHSINSARMLSRERE
jgi:hypothetical protein